MAIRRAIALALALAFAPLCAAEQDTALEMRGRVKAAYLYKFASYVEWPAESFPAPGNAIVIGVAGADALAAELEKLVVGREVADRPLSVRRIKPGEPAGRCCQMLFLGAGVDRADAVGLLGAAKGSSVLTVTDSRSSHPDGSVINFVEAGDRVRFDISREAAERNQLQLRSQLLSVARQVISP